jgi:hypothetical protein
MERVGWAFEPVKNPTVLRVHTVLELTDSKIATCPPADAPMALHGVLQLPGVRSIDLHRHRFRVNLAPGASLEGLRATVRTLLERAWGPEIHPRPHREPPRSFPAAPVERRHVVEGVEMVKGDALMAALWRCRGVVEVQREGAEVRVWLSPLYRWDAVADDIGAVLGSRSPVHLSDTLD